MYKSTTYDVVVVGGGAAGVAAAIGAVKAGAHCLLIERYGCLGGQATIANVSSYCGFFNHAKNPEQIVKGIGQEILEELHELGYYDKINISPAGNAIVALDQEATKFAFDEVVGRYPVDVLMHCRAIKAEMAADKKHIASLVCTDDESIFEIQASVFVDASGDANLAHMAGAEVRFGDGKGGCYFSTKMMRLDRVGKDVKFKPALLEEIFSKAKKDGYKCLTKESGIVFRVGDDTAYAILPSVAVPALDARTLTECEINTRRQAQDYLAVFRKYMPGMENCRLISTGAQLGMRDTRHVIGETILTGDDVLNAVKREDGVARGGWPCEMHVDLNKMAKYLFVKDDDYYEIPLGCLKSKNIANLWCAGRTISADPIAFASVRVMGTGFATGHAAGVAAAFSVTNQAVAKDVQKELLRQQALI